LTASAHVCEHNVNAFFVDQAQCSAGDAQAHPTVLSLHPETAVLQIGHETTLGFVVGVGNIVSDHGAFARDFTYACHKDTPILFNGPAMPDKSAQPNLTSPKSGWR